MLSVVGVTLRTNANIALQCAYHVVWCPKYRRKVIGGRVEPRPQGVIVEGVAQKGGEVIGGRMEQRLKEIIVEVIAEKGAWLIELETMADHVHLVVEVDPQFGIHKMVKAIKGRSSRVLREEFPWLKSKLPSLWTNSYFVVTVGGAPLSVIKRYVETQKDR